MVPERFSPVLEELKPLARLFADAGHRLYLVGGTVRDLFLDSGAIDVDAIDFDATTDAHPEQIKAIVSGWAETVWTQGEKFGTIGLKKNGRSYEITTHRAEAYSPDSRNPEVRFGDNIEDDLARRDFTINAMALEVTSDAPTLVDPYGGIVDLMSKVLRTPLSPEESFNDDPLRMLRAARFIARMELVPVPELVTAARDLHERLGIVSRERIRVELDKLITADHPSAGLWFVVDTGLATMFLPELPAMRLEQDPIHRHKDVLTHTLAVVENVRPNAHDDFDFRITRLSARMTRDRLRELKYPNEDVEAITELVALHLRFHTYQMGWTDSAVRRYVRDAGELLNELNVLTRCDCTTRNEKKARLLSERMDDLENRIAELAGKEELAALRPEMDGVQVMEFLGIRPGREVGEALDFLMEIRLEEGLVGDHEIRERLKAWWTNR